LVWTPDKVIPKLVNQGDFDSNGNMGIPVSKTCFGTTVDKLRHKISIPLLIVKLKLVSLPAIALSLILETKIKDALLSGLKKRKTLSEENYLKPYTTSPLFLMQM
jgi:hypothetical protein